MSDYIILLIMLQLFNLMKFFDIGKKNSAGNKGNKVLVNEPGLGQHTAGQELYNSKLESPSDETGYPWCRQHRQIVSWTRLNSLLSISWNTSLCSAQFLLSQNINLEFFMREQNLCLSSSDYC